MNEDYVCTYIGHDEEPIQGFCFNQECQMKDEFCVQCFTLFHSAHTGECKSFNQIKQMIKSYANVISDWSKNVNDEFNKILLQYNGVQKFLENEKNKMIELQKILNEKNYKSFSDDLDYFKQWQNLSQTQIIYDNIINILNQFNGIMQQLTPITQIIQQKENKNDNYAQGLLHKQNKEYDLALQCFEDAIKGNPQNSQVWYQKGWVLHDINKYQEAIQCFEKAISIDPNFALAQSVKGECLNLHYTNITQFLELKDKINKNQYIQASQKIETQSVQKEEILKTQILKQIKNNSYYDQGLSHKKKGEHQLALQFFEMAIKENPKNESAWFYKGYVLADLGLYIQAIQCYDQAIILDPKDFIAYNNKGNALQYLNRNDEAIKCFDQAILLNRKYAFSYNNKGISLQNLNLNEEAIKYFDQAITLDRKYTYAYNNKGISLQNLKRFEEAIMCYNQAISLNPKYTDAYKNKGDALKKIGRNNEATICLDQADAIKQQK